MPKVGVGSAIAVAIGLGRRLFGTVFLPTENPGDELGSTAAWNATNGAHGSDLTNSQHAQNARQSEPTPRARGLSMIRSSARWCGNGSARPA